MNCSQNTGGMRMPGRMPMSGPNLMPGSNSMPGPNPMMPGSPVSMPMPPMPGAVISPAASGGMCAREPKCSGQGSSSGREQFPVGMGYVPMQNWETPYPMEQGFRWGTIFPSLNYPFMGGRCR